MAMYIGTCQPENSSDENKKLMVHHKLQIVNIILKDRSWYEQHRDYLTLFNKFNYFKIILLIVYISHFYIFIKTL